MENQPATGPQETLAKETAPPTTDADGGEQGVLWVAEGQHVRPIFVQIGLSDEDMTEVEGEGLVEGMEVVTGQQEIQETSAGGSNPFLPKFPRMGKRRPPPPM